MLDLPYDPFNWYWRVGNKIYGSKANTYVEHINAEFTAFLNGGGIPTQIRSEDELINVLLPYGIVPPFCSEERHTKWALENAPPAMRHLYNMMMKGR
jgi:hypothetical protein